MLAQSAHCMDEESWALIEHHSTLGLERCLEDHEIVVQVQSSWPVEGDTKLLFRKNYAKYEFFKKPVVLKSGCCPEIQGFLQVREGGKKSWKKLYFILRQSGLYCSNKGQSKEPRHLQFAADLEDLNVYTVFNGRKHYGAPGEHVFCIKASKDRFRSQDLKLMCADTEQSRTCWITAFRLFKHGKQLQVNYQLSQSSFRLQKPSKQDSKKREALRHSLPGSVHSSQASALDRVQPWFHGGVSRTEAQRLLEEQGQVDGMFLIRDSNLHPQCFVLSLSYKLKTKHYLIIPLEQGDRQHYTMDDGVTLFSDLLQLVEFHQINRGILPVCLKHPCTCIAL
ncbi:hypothetical protein DNTS_033323 [Danionella cerebrum]|uniref:Growth factor receptor-bound protein 7 n=1 Tax=Danionella cerebrum TaxID=2873325 RepID=A0A553PUY7_9TELE|nr:hypothetical protein DNTS_033323 [Danionella translucida]